MNSIRWMYRNPAGSSVRVEITEPEMFTKSDVITKSFLNIVAIVGSARAGKSTLMNCIAGKDVFETSNDGCGCTKGVWISNNKKNTGENGVVVYVDTEGEGNANQEKDTKLLTPVVLLSKVILLNIMGAVLIHQVLEKLQVFLYIGKHLNLADDNSFKLGHLVIVLRDYKFEETEEDAYDRLLKKENSNDDDAKKRNEIRKKIFSVFASVRVFIFGTSLTEMETNQEVRNQVNKLKSIIDDKVSTPRKFKSGSSTCIDPGNVNEVAKEIVDQLNTPNEAFKIESLVCLMECRNVDKAKNVYLDRFLDITGPSKLILPVENIEEILTKKKENLIEEFMKVTSNEDSVSEYRDGVKEELDASLQKQLMFAKQANEPLFKIVSRAKTRFDDKLQQAARQISLPTNEPENIKMKLDQETRDGVKIFREDTREIDVSSPYKKQVLNGLVTSSNEKKRSMCEENENRLKEREIIEREKEAFVDELAKDIANIHFPITNVDQVLLELRDKHSETFDRNTKAVEYEKKYKENIKIELEDHCEKESNKAKQKNEKGNRYLGFAATGIGGAIGGGGIVFAVVAIETAAIAATTGIAAGVLVGGLLGYAGYKVIKHFRNAKSKQS